jgi:glycolate oxidase FAD binding subunit
VSIATSPLHVANDLREICGAAHVIEYPAQLGQHKILGAMSAIAVEPASAEEIAAILRVAHEDGLNIVPAGGLTQQQAGNSLNQVDILLHSSRITQVEHYDPGDLTVGVGAGCTVAQLTSMVEADGLFFAGDPPLPGRATIGGMLASGISGPQRHGYGGLRDYCIGIRFVTGDGRKGRGGGRVVKNVAGYDMMKLLIGSWGTLAIITGASFKLFPTPRQTRTFVAEFATAADAIEYRNAVLRSPLSPICLEVVSPEGGAILCGERQSAKAWSIYLRAAGSDSVLTRYRRELGSTILREMEDRAEQDVWRAIRDFPQTIRETHPDALLLSLYLPLTDVLPTLQNLESLGASNGAKFAAIGRIGVGHLLVGLWPTGSQTSVAAIASTLRDRLLGSASLNVLHCPDEMRSQFTEWRKTPTHLESMRAVKRALDPKDILNRGRFIF